MPNKNAGIPARSTKYNRKIPLLTYKESLKLMINYVIERNI